MEKNRGGGKAYADKMMENNSEYYDKSYKERQKYEDEIRFLSDEIYKTTKDSLSDEGGKNKLSNGNGTGAVNREFKGAGKTTKAKKEHHSVGHDELKKAQDEHQKSIEENDKFNKELLEKEYRFLEEKRKIIQDSREKEIEIENTNRKKQKESIDIENKEKITAQKKIELEIQNLSKQRDESQNPKAKDEYNSAISQKQSQLAQLKRLIDENNKISEQQESTHQNNLNKINEKWDLEELSRKEEEIGRISKMYQSQRELEISEINSLEELKSEIRNAHFVKYSEDELQKIKTLEEAKKVLLEDLNREMLQKELDNLQKRKKALSKLLKSFSGEALNKLKKDLNELDGQINKIKSSINGNTASDEQRDEKNKDEALSKVDILGFSAKDWEEMFNNLGTTEGKIMAVSMAVKALGNAFSQFSQYQKTLNDIELRNFTQNQDKKKHALLVQLNQGLISQEEYHKKLELLEKQRANKSSELAYKEAKVQRALRIADAISASALGVVNSLKVGGFLGIALASIVGALGAVQVGIISSTPLPERESFAKGGYTGEGYGVPDKTGKKPAGIVHQGEYVTPQWMLENPVIADTVEWMESIRTGRQKIPRGYAEGGLVKKHLAENSNQTSQPVNFMGEELVSVLHDMKNFLEKIDRNGVDAYIVENAENGRKIKNMIKTFEKIEFKNAKRT